MPGLGNNRQVEILRSMFPGKDEFHMEELHLILDIPKWIESRAPDKVDFLSALLFFTFKHREKSFANCCALFRNKEI